MLNINNTKFVPVDITSRNQEIKISIREHKDSKVIVLNKSVKKALGDPEYIDLFQSEKMDEFVLVAGTEKKVNSIKTKNKDTQYLSNKKLIALFDLYKKKTNSDEFFGELKDKVIYFSLEGE